MTRLLDGMLPLLCLIVAVGVLILALASIWIIVGIAAFFVGSYLIGWGIEKSGGSR